MTDEEIVTWRQMIGGSGFQFICSIHGHQADHLPVCPTCYDAVVAERDRLRAALERIAALTNQSGQAED